MYKKLTYKEVKKYFKDHDCKLLETEYINAHTKMEYECVCENTSYITFDSFKRGSRCKECGRKRQAEKRRHIFKDVKQYFKDRDCKLLETEYINNKTPMRYECDCGNDDCKICFSSFKRGSRCDECMRHKIAKKQAYTYEFIYNYFEDHNCKLLETEYINAHTKMDYECVCGNKSKTTFNNFQQGKYI